jgi:hypothetical protein
VIITLRREPMAVTARRARSANAAEHHLATITS